MAALNGWMGGDKASWERGPFSSALAVLRSPSISELLRSGAHESTPGRAHRFGLLNSEVLRFSVAATDVETGEPVILDSSHHKIDMDHLLASCGFLPEFAPVELGGRLLVDGGLLLNAPFDPLLEADVECDLLLYVVDLYARDCQRPRSLEAALERKSNLYVRQPDVAEAALSIGGEKATRTVVERPGRPEAWIECVRRSAQERTLRLES
jgi:predicted acylesterase/phospholipase RssA